MRIAALALCALALGGCSLPRLDNSALTQNSNSTENVVKSTNVETANQSMSNDGQKTGATYTDEGIASKVGIAAHFGNDSGCLRTQNAELMSGQRIFVVNDPSVLPQKLIKAVIVEKLSVSCADDSDIGDSAELLEKTSYYKIERYYRDEVETNGIFWGIAILDISKTIKNTNGFVIVDLTNDGVNEYFRDCTSNEGVHYTVWSGKPLIGKRIWHRYYYLRYDTVPTCKKKDYEGTDE